MKISSVLLACFVALFLAAIPTSAKLPEKFEDLKACHVHCYRDCAHENALEQAITQQTADLQEIHRLPAYKAELFARKKNPSAFRPIEDELRSASSLDNLSLAAREAYLQADLANSRSELADYAAWKNDLSVTMLGWDCEENCRYECMQMDNTHRIQNGETSVKYNGKWPFTRILGTQEFFSTIFSIANLLPHATYFFIWRAKAPKGHYMTPIMLFFSISATHTWWWSTAFHARDNWFTHNMDYFFATFSIMVMVFWTIVRISGIKNYNSMAYIAAPMFLYFIFHVYYMLYVEWNYEYNMNLAIVLGVTFCGSWIVNGLYNYKRKPYAWKILVATINIAFFAGFEVFDFPPLFGLLDAHAIWHGATPISCVLMWQYMLEDCQKDGYEALTLGKIE